MRVRVCVCKCVNVCEYTLVQMCALACVCAYVHTCVCKLKLDEKECLRASSQAIVKCLLILVIVEVIILYTFIVNQYVFN